MTSTTTKASWGAKGFIWVKHLGSQSIAEANQSRIQAGADRNHGNSGLFTGSWFSYLTYSKPTCPGMVPPTVGLALPYQLARKHPQACPRFQYGTRNSWRLPLHRCVMLKSKMSHPVIWVKLVDNIAQDLFPCVGCAVGPRLMILPTLLKPHPLLFLMKPFITPIIHYQVKAHQNSVRVVVVGNRPFLPCWVSSTLCWQCLILHHQPFIYTTLKTKGEFGKANVSPLQYVTINVSL